MGRLRLQIILRLCMQMFYKDGCKMVERERSGVKMWLSDRKAEHEEVLKESQIKDKVFPVN